MTKPTIDIAATTARERLELAEELRNSLATDPEALLLSDEQAAELDRRVAAYRADHDPGRPRAEVLAEIEAACLLEDSRLLLQPWDILRTGQSKFLFRSGILGPRASSM